MPVRVMLALVTVRVVVPTMPRIALITVWPGATPVAKPALLMVAMPGGIEVQVTCPVMLAVLPLEYVPVATNCCVEPRPILGFAGVTVIEVSDGGGAPVTVRVVVPVMPRIALITVEPGATPVAKPGLVMKAMFVMAEAQVTCPVMLAVLPLEYVPVAANCCVEPTPMVGFTGVTVIEISDGGGVAGTQNSRVKAAAHVSPGQQGCCGKHCPPLRRAPPADGVR